MNQLMDVLMLAAIVGTGLVAGIFFAFSSFVMKALGQLLESEGIAAMKAINITVINPWFFLAFFGTGALCLPILLLSDWDAYLLAGAALYLLGCLLVTLLFNVPLNNRLAVAELGSADANELWRHYLARWTLFNHVRTGASLAASGCFVLALL